MSIDELKEFAIELKELKENNPAKFYELKRMLEEISGNKKNIILKK
jgi:hypothetical protein